MMLSAAPNRKRNLEEASAGSSSKAANSDPSCVLHPFLPLRRLRLEAVFHPKFENENQREQSIRNRMKELCGGGGSDVAQSGGGYLEVSLKHSGSLLLWSGGSRYYSKNSTDNQFTAAGEVLLRQHFVRAFWNGNAATSLGGAATTGEAMYEKCSEYVQEKRLTLAFEVVTAVLADHGARPKRDFLILTAVADRSRRPLAQNSSNGIISRNVSDSNIFFGTVELMQFAQEHRLPHNDCWICFGAGGGEKGSSGDALFDFYDRERETATASTAISALTRAANCHVPSMYPHADFQGEIMEGIVIRYVPWCCGAGDRDTAMRQMAQLSQRARDILKAVPPSLPDCFELMRAVQPVHEEKKRDLAITELPPTPALLTTNLRHLYRDCRAAYSKKGADEFEARLRQLVSVVADNSKLSGSTTLSHRRCIERLPRAGIDVPAWMNALLKEGSLDRETQQVANLVQSLANVSQKVVYSVFRVQYSGAPDEESRYLCIIRVIHDQTFQKFEQRRKKGEMPLFRGFCFELIGGSQQTSAADAAEKDASNSTDATPMAESSVDDDGTEDRMDTEIQQEILMLKMKFLPYMVRTFGCRNGLSVLRQGGIGAFTKYTSGLMLKWGISQTAQQKWRPFFRAWAQYAHQRMAGGSARTQVSHLPPLAESNYLDHLELFSELFESGTLVVNAEMNESACSLQGLVVVVALNRETAKTVADCIARQLGGAARMDDIKKVNPDLMDLACERGRGHVCSAAVEDGFAAIRKLLKNYADFISLVLFQCTEKEVSQLLLPSKTEKMTAGMLKGWRGTRCSQTIELPGSSLYASDSTETDDGQCVRPSAEFVEAVSKLKQKPDTDKRCGVLVFFPAIPGSGKSACVSSTEHDLYSALEGTDEKQHRNLIVQIGDKTKEKYWALVKRTRLKDRSSVYIADKNAPSSVWGSIGELCAATKALAVPVLPDASALVTTRIDGIRLPGGSYNAEVVHVYPFSLQFLALCMARVMERLPGSHAGNLDQATSRGCMIVVNFFALYRSISADEFLETLTTQLSRAGALVTPSPIEIPFFRSGSGNRALPHDLEDVLIEALQCHYGYARVNVDACRAEGPLLDDLEKRLREHIQKYRAQLLGLAAEESATGSSFVLSVIQKVKEADSIASYEAPSFIKIAAIDVDVNAIHQLLLDLKPDERYSTFFQITIGERHIDDVLSGNGANLVLAEKCRFVLKTHVTLAHCRHMSQSDLRSAFETLCGSKVQLSATGLLWNERVAAISVNAPTETETGIALPPFQNSFAHITIWFEEGASAVSANELPGLHEKGEARRVEFESPVSLGGVVSLWDI